MNNSNPTGTGCPVLPLFREIAHNMKEKGNRHTAANYESFINKLALFLDEEQELFPLHKINKEWINHYIQWLHDKHPQKTQTVDFYFRGLRTLYNKAVRKEGVGEIPIMNPFCGLHIKKTPVPKRALPAKILKRLLDPELKTRLTESRTKSLDILLFSLYCRGMVFHDMYNLTWDMVSNDWQAQYCRSKTGRYIRLYIPREGQEIMLHYQQPGNLYVFPFLREKANGRFLCEKSALRRVNRHLNGIGKLLDLPCKLTTYVIRHTWATLMLEAGKPVEVISQSLGHTSIKTTQIYLSSISTAKIDNDVNDMLNRFVRQNKHKRKKGGYRAKNLSPVYQESEIIKQMKNNPEIKKTFSIKERDFFKTTHYLAQRYLYFFKNKRNIS